MDNTDKFSGRAESYVKARPDYASEMIHYITDKFGITENTIIADVGSGTGKFSKEFLKLGCKVFCVEPNDDMRNTAEKLLSSYPNFISVNGTCDNTALEDKSIDIVTVAQAFHWFDADKFKLECKRILKTGGTVVLAYNHRVDSSEFVIENAEICKKFCPNFKGFSNKFNDTAISKINTFFNGKYEIQKFPNNLTYSKEKFIERMLSASYSLTEKDNNFDEYIKALEQLFDKYSVDNIVTMPNESFSYIGTP